MNLLFCHDTYYSRRRDGTVYSYGAFPYSLWERRFLPHFEKVTVIGRKKKLSPQENGALDISSGQNVEHVLLPNINSPLKRLTQSWRIYRKISEQVKLADAVVIRGPIEFGLMAATAARLAGKPYAVEMCGCIYDRMYYSGSFLSRIYAPLKFKRARHMVLHADAVMYVTEKFLQERYPTKGKSAFASNVEIDAAPEYVLTNRLRRIEEEHQLLIIGLVGNFSSGLKGLNVAFDALGQVLKEEQDFRFKILGQGMAAQWMGLIKAQGLEGKVEFCGVVPSGKAVLEWLDGVDLYLQPSFQEGLPRALIEAMSRGCPALASDAGGTAELLMQRFIHPRGNASILAEQILKMIRDKSERLQAVRYNFEKAKNYSCETLGPKRFQFWADFAALARSKKA